jgi:excisionase family DNA binding protein
MVHISTVTHISVAFQHIGGSDAEEVSERVARLHNIESVMDRLNVGRSTVFSLMASGQLRSCKVGRRRLIPESAIVDFIDNLVPDDAQAAGVG